jgi:hypothetical protein
MKIDLTNAPVAFTFSSLESKRRITKMTSTIAAVCFAFWGVFCFLFGYWLSTRYYTSKITWLIYRSAEEMQLQIAQARAGQRRPDKPALSMSFVAQRAPEKEVK